MGSNIHMCNPVILFTVNLILWFSFTLCITSRWFKDLCNTLDSLPDTTFQSRACFPGT